jgi:hypothetical protein
MMNNNKYRNNVWKNGGMEKWRGGWVEVKRLGSGRH